MSKTISIVLTDGTHGSLALDLIKDSPLGGTWTSTHEGGRLGIDKGTWATGASSAVNSATLQDGKNDIATLNDFPFDHVEPHATGTGQKMWFKGTFDENLSWRVI